MNLPAAIEDLAGTSVPNSVLEKAARMREMGGHTMIHGLMNSLPELLTRNKEILDEVRLYIIYIYISFYRGNTLYYVIIKVMSLHCY